MINLIKSDGRLWYIIRDYGFIKTSFVKSILGYIFYHVLLYCLIPSNIITDFEMLTSPFPLQENERHSEWQYLSSDLKY